MAIPICPTLVIGLGGTGQFAVSEIKKLAYEYGYIRPGHPFPLLKFLAIDTEFITTPDRQKIREKYEKLSDSEGIDVEFEATFESRLEEHEMVDISATRDEMIPCLEDPTTVGAEDFVDKRYMEEVVKGVRGFGAGGFGIVGKLALWRLVERVRDEIDNCLDLMNDNDSVSTLLSRNYPGEYARDQYFNIFVICSIGGGTGKGAFLPVGAIISEYLRQMPPPIFDNSTRFLINFMPSCFRTAGRDVSENYYSTIQANQYAAYKELEYVLRHGYPVEEKIENLFPGLRDAVSEEIYTHVLNVSRTLSEGSIFIGDYKTLNRAVAETVLALTFSGLGGTIRAYWVSNKKSHETSNPLREHAAPTAERCRDYGRIGRYKLKFPVDQLFRYAEKYYAKETLRDMRSGHLFLSGKKEDELQKPSSVADKITSEFFDDAGKILEAASFFGFEDIRFSCRTFKDAWGKAIRDQIAGRRDNLNAEFRFHAEKIAALVRYHLLGDNRTQKSGAMKVLQDYIKDYGLTKTQVVIDEIVEDLEGYLTGRLKDYLPDSTDVPKYQKEFSFEHNSSVIQKKIAQERDAEDLKLREYTEESEGHFHEIANALGRDEANWNKANDGILIRSGLVKPGSQVISDETERAIKTVIVNSEKVYNNLCNICDRYILLEAINKLYDELIKIKQRLRENQETIRNLVQIYKSQATSIAQEEIDSLELRITGNNEKEFEQFAKDLEFSPKDPVGSVVVAEHLQSALNNHRVHESELERDMEILPGWDNTFIGLLATTKVHLNLFEKVLDREVGVISTHLRDRFSICSELQKMSPEKLGATFNRLVNNASFLGNLDSSKNQGGSIEEAALRGEFLQVENPDLVQSVKHVLPPSWRNFQIIPFRNREEIILTRIETSLPLYAFSELYTAQTKFVQLSKATGRKHVQFRMERHTHKDFIWIEEPFGSTNQIPDDDINVFVNLMMHMGILKIDSSQYILHRDKVEESKIEKQNVFKRVPDPRDKRNRPITLRGFVEQINKSHLLFGVFAEKLRMRLRFAFDRARHVPPEEKEAMQKYFVRYFRYPERALGEKGFPYIPNVLLSYIRQKSLDDSTESQQELGYFIAEYEAENLDKAERLKMEEEIVPACKSMEELLKYYDEPDYQYFQIVHLPQPEPTQLESSRNAPPVPDRKRSADLAEEMSIGDWLNRHGLSLYRPQFEEQEIEAESLKDLTDEDIKNLIPNPEDQQKFRNALVQFHGGDIRLWLRELQLEEEYGQAFEEQDIKLEDLLDVTEEDLKSELGVTKMGHRKRMMRSIKEIIDKKKKT